MHIVVGPNNNNSNNTSNNSDNSQSPPGSRNNANKMALNVQYPNRGPKSFPPYQNQQPITFGSSTANPAIVSNTINNPSNPSSNVPSSNGKLFAYSRYKPGVNSSADKSVNSSKEAPRGSSRNGRDSALSRKRLNPKRVDYKQTPPSSLYDINRK